MSSFRLDSEDDQEPEKLQHLTDSPTPVEGHGDNNVSTKTEEPDTSQLDPTDCK